MPKLRFPLSTEPSTKFGLRGRTRTLNHFFLDKDLSLTQVEVLHECFMKWEQEIRQERIDSQKERNPNEYFSSTRYWLANQKKKLGRGATSLKRKGYSLLQNTLLVPIDRRRLLKSIARQAESHWQKDS